ncbi:peptide chain release factor N(5)-glutamine methyltransferase [Pedomonas mirosovicensis]|uniref:peptide chain release factor N(5)-glutamine methyltransferase n=1 Tax=Pedomonas mirosovicensis TaxID=2908641 RepID=UPI0021689CE2|nr:peptide chain release factor N(5)-glutamine methyltransferase [Pedomonas mirosovicensis]MCH8683722.1 peptide chain release factor N(5)-glutamine methyltransferase [Pedomonas mirosovicensis]
MTRAEAMRRAAGQLAAAGLLDPRLDAEVLLAHVLGMPRLVMLIDTSREITDAEVRAFEALVARRETHEPVAYITGMREFWSLDFRVTPATLIPRPDSETLVEAALSAFPQERPARVLDLGTGSGCLLLSVLHEFPGSFGVGVDRSEAAAMVAADNAARLGLQERAAFIVGDWAGALVGTFDCILANPPYIGEGEALSPEVAAFEPVTALFAGPDGLDDYRRIIPELARLLSPRGHAFFEIGYTQAEAVGRIAEACGLSVRVHNDLAGHPRCVECWRGENFLGKMPGNG